MPFPYVHGEALIWSAHEEGIDDLEAFFEYAGYRARDMREPLSDIKDHIQQTMRLQFLTEGEYRSGGWEDLAPEYAEWKEERAPGLPILVLHRDVPDMKEVVLSDDSWFVGMKEAEFYPNDPKVGWHQAGVADRQTGRGKPNPLPARPILELNEYDYEYMEQVFYEWLDFLRLANRRRGVPDPSIRPTIFFG